MNNFFSHYKNILWSGKIPQIYWTLDTDYIYIYAFSRRFYPKRLTLHSGYTFFVSMCVPWELNPQYLRC